jgi:hypothetical protein
VQNNICELNAASCVSVRIRFGAEKRLARLKDRLSPAANHRPLLNLSS